MTFEEAVWQFARDVLSGYENGEVGDIDGLWLEDRAYALGLIVDHKTEGYVLAPDLVLMTKQGE